MNRRGWTPDEIRRALPIGQTPAFETKWQALMRQLETVLSIAHQREPNCTQTAEAVSIAKHHLAGIGELLERKTSMNAQDTIRIVLNSTEHRRADI